MTKKILVTGATGYIGSHTVLELLKNSYEVIMLDNLINSSKASLARIAEIAGFRPKFLHLDLRNKRDLKENLIKQGKIDAIIHFAALKQVDESVREPIKYYENNLLSTINILELMSELEIANLVFSSSASVYGQPDKIPVGEKSLLKPASSPYGNSKKICEEIISDVVTAKKIKKAISLRYFNPLGAHLSGEIGEEPSSKSKNVAKEIVSAALSKKKDFVINGNDYDTRDGTALRDFFHVSDLAQAHVMALENIFDNKNVFKYDVFNLGSGQGTTVLELVKAFEKANNIKINYRFGPRRPGDVGSCFADISRAKKILGWQPKISLGRAMESAWKWVLKQNK